MVGIEDQANEQDDAEPAYVRYGEDSVPMSRFVRDGCARLKFAGP